MPASIGYAPVKGIQSHVLEKNGKLTSPLSVSLEITNDCNQDCVFCVQSVKRRTGSLEKHHISLEYLETLLNKAQSLGVLEFQISGGEPACHPHFMDIVERVKEFQFHTLIITNGVNFSSSDLKRLAGILDPEEDIIIIGLDAADPINYKTLRGQDHFTLVCETLGMMQKAHLPFATQTVILKNNVGFLEDVWKVSISYGSRAHMLVLPYRIKNVREDIYLSDEEITSYLANHGNNLKRQRATGTPLVLPKNFVNKDSAAIHKVCSSGRTSCAINALGEIHVCAFALDCGLSVGNINNTSLGDAWKKIHKFIETTGGANGLLHGHHCPVKAELLHYDLTDA